jgi:3-deoxy-7-phosphoheptulonate synthase
MIDCSHANCCKDYRRQADVAADVSRQVASGDRIIIGVMIESHLVGGRQDIVPGVDLAYGKSVTDPCLGWEESIPLLDALAQAVRQRRQTQSGK